MIYLQIRTELFLKTLIITLLLLFIVLTGYFSSFILYDDKESVTISAIELETTTLQNIRDELAKYENLEGDYKIGRVIERDLYNFYNEIVINLGSKDGIKEKDAVINDEGLIGIVYKVMENYSTVKLLTGNYNVSVRINDTYGNLNKGRVTLLDKYSNINESDKIYTSGYSSIIKDIYIGTITKVSLDKENLGKEVTVKLIDNTHLNYIAVLRGPQ